MLTSQNIGAIAEALAKAQSELRNPEKDATNPHFRSRYVQLDGVINAIKGVLSKNGIAYLQSIGAEGAAVSCTTRLIHKSGEWIESDPMKATGKDAGPQSVGSVVTYLRRYSLLAVCGIAATDDDDAESGDGRETDTVKDATAPASNAEKVKAKAPASGKAADRLKAIVAGLEAMGMKTSAAREVKAKAVLGHPFNPANEADLAAMEKFLQSHADVDNAAEVLGAIEQKKQAEYDQRVPF